MDEANGTTWHGMDCPEWARPILEANREHIVDVLRAKGRVLTRRQRDNLRRQRAMLLCHVDEIEQELGYGEVDGKERTSKIREFWKNSGRPPL